MPCRLPTRPLRCGPTAFRCRRPRSIAMPFIDAPNYRRTPVGLRMLAALALVCVVPSSEAQEFGPGFYNVPGQMRRPPRLRHPLAHHSHGRDVGVEPRKPAEAKPVGGPLFAILSLSEQHISIYNGAGLVARSKVSTGMPGHRTPTGIFSIIGRERWHHSNIYSGAPMPYMQRITWSGVALHLGVVPGYPASHGCIRLPSGFAERLRRTRLRPSRCCATRSPRGRCVAWTASKKNHNHLKLRLFLAVQKYEYQ